jgi:hypothetical protein
MVCLQNIGKDLGVLLTLAVMLRVLAFLALLRKVKKSRTITTS